MIIAGTGESTLKLGYFRMSRSAVLAVIAVTISIAVTVPVITVSGAFIPIRIAVAISVRIPVSIISIWVPPPPGRTPTPAPPPGKAEAADEDDAIVIMIMVNEVIRMMIPIAVPVAAIPRAHSAASERLPASRRHRTEMLASTEMAAITTARSSCD